MVVHVDEHRRMIKQLCRLADDYFNEHPQETNIAMDLQQFLQHDEKLLLWAINHQRTARSLLTPRHIRKVHLKQIKIMLRMLTDVDEGFYVF